MRYIALAVLSIVSGNALAASVLIDEFTIIKNDNVIFNDTFSNGIAPSDNGGNSQSYRVFGAPLGAETGGKLELDARAGESATRPDAGEMNRQGARVSTNRNIETPNKGLRTDDTFSVTGLFDLTFLSSVRERYGVRLTDGAADAPAANDSVGVSVMRTSETQLNVVFHTYDKVDFTFFDLESIELDIGHEQISLRLSRNNLATNDITASFAYVDGGVLGNYTDFTVTDSIFNGEDYTRAAFMYLAPVPIPAAVWLLGSGFLGLMAVAKRRKRS